MRMRRAVTLIEVIISMFIILILAGLLIPAVQHARMAAAGTQNRNQLRQIVIGMHNYASAHSGRLPGARSQMLRITDQFPLRAILPFVGVAPPYEIPSTKGFVHLRIALYWSNLDPTLIDVSDDMLAVGPSSYAVNMSAFSNSPRMDSSFIDGTSHTIGVVEHYFYTQNRYNRLCYSGISIAPSVECDIGSRSASFADPAWKDCLPLTGGLPRSSKASLPGATFQVVPRPEDADGRLPQAMQRSGLKAAMMDGSVRTYSAGVREAVFWGAVTPAGGEFGVD